jgi:hypothetical protein
MLYFNINIRNPWWSDRWASIKSWSGKTPWEHKFWEAQLMRDVELLGIEFNWTARQDHAGLTLEFGLLGYKVNFSFNDNRHWHTDKGRWVNHDDLEEMRELYPTHFK